jgi:AcrR family transcriptional regulator
MPKEVDHDARRRELADAACRVIARHGPAGTTLAHVAEESGWSIGSIRYYFPNKDELVASALWRVGERVDDRIRRRTGQGMTMSDLRAAAVELLPLDAGRREEALVYLAFQAQAAVVPALADASEDAAQRLQEPLAARIDYLVRTGELPQHLRVEHEAARLRLLLDGLRLQLLTIPRHTTPSWAMAALDDHLTALAAGGSHGGSLCPADEIDADFPG